MKVSTVCLLFMQVDTAELQHENHKLAQLLDAQRSEIHDLEAKLKDLKQKQISYNENLASIQDAWEEVSPPSHTISLL